MCASRQPIDTRPCADKDGSFLLEGMIALLIFAFGILGLIGMLAGSIRASNDARYRAEAINLANAMVGDMWTTQPADLDTEFGTGGAKLTAWQDAGGELCFRPQPAPMPPRSI